MYTVLAVFYSKEDTNALCLEYNSTSAKEAETFLETITDRFVKNAGASILELDAKTGAELFHWPKGMDADNYHKIGCVQLDDDYYKVTRAVLSNLSGKIGCEVSKLIH